jgi:hypothetical protein
MQLFLSKHLKIYPIMKTKQTSHKSILLNFLDKYIYYVVVNKAHKQSRSHSEIVNIKGVSQLSRA